MTVFTLLVLAHVVSAAEPAQQMHLSDEQRGWFVNPDGSCVQCSIGMCGVHVGDLNAACLLWDTAYGRAERGGSGPSRVAGYCNRRGIEAWNITGRETKDWMIWAAKTRRFAAIGFFAVHFQTEYGYDPGTKEWLVANNWYADPVDCEITKYSDSEFDRHHKRSGEWAVILKKPRAKPPKYLDTWK